MKKMTARTKDIISITIVAIALFVAMYVVLGYSAYGLNVPAGYSGGDEFPVYADIKAVVDSGWNGFSPNTGAPYGSVFSALLPKNLSNFDFLVTKLISLFTKDVFVISNLQFLFIISMCVVTSFIVLRWMKIRRSLAIFGAVLYALSPYIFCRGIVHFPIAECYFAPLTVYLCLWASGGGYPLLCEGRHKGKDPGALPGNRLLLAYGQ